MNDTEITMNYVRMLLGLLAIVLLLRRCYKPRGSYIHPLIVFILSVGIIFITFQLGVEKDGIGYYSFFLICW